MELPPLLRRPLAHHLLADEEVSRAVECRNDPGGRLVRRLEVPLNGPRLARGAPQPVPVAQVDRHPFTPGRRGDGVGQEGEERLEVEHPGERPARLPHGALIVRVCAVHVAVQDPARDVADERDQQADEGNRGERGDQLVGLEV